MNIQKINKVSDFFIRIVMLLTTFIALMYFSSIYSLSTYFILGFLFLIAIVIKGITDFLIARRKE